MRGHLRNVCLLAALGVLAAALPGGMGAAASALWLSCVFAYAFELWGQLSANRFGVEGALLALRFCAVVWVLGPVVIVPTEVWRYVNSCFEDIRTFLFEVFCLMPAGLLLAYSIGVLSMHWTLNVALSKHYREETQVSEGRTVAEVRRRVTRCALLHRVLFCLRGLSLLHVLDKVCPSPK